MKKYIFGVIGLTMSIVLLGAGCRVQTPSHTTNQSTVTTRTRGLSFSPSAVTAAGISDFYNRATQSGTFVSWGGPVSDVPSGRPGSTIVTQIRAHRLTPVVIVSPSATDLTSTSTWSAWTTPVIAFARDVKPEYLCVGNEINKGLTDDPRTAFLNRLPQLVNDIHAASPTTKVCVTLQYERLNGLHGGLFGRKNDPTQAQWSLLEQLSALDLVAFTTYPGLIYKNPGDIPQEYFTNIRLHTQAPVAFTEIGWFRTGPEGWDSSVDEQVQFIRTFRQQTETLNPVFSLWSFLYDPVAKAPFDTMGLLAKGATTSTAWQEWTK